MLNQALLASRPLYNFIRRLLLPFFVVFGVLSCSLAFPFLDVGVNLDSLIFFSLLFAIIFSLPFQLFPRIGSALNKEEASSNDCHRGKLLCVLLVDFLLVAVTVLTVSSIVHQTGNASLLANRPLLALTASISVTSAFFAGWFSFTFYFTEPIR